MSSPDAASGHSETAFRIVARAPCGALACRHRVRGRHLLCSTPGKQLAGIEKLPVRIAVIVVVCEKQRIVSEVETVGFTRQANVSELNLPGIGMRTRSPGCLNSSPPGVEQETDMPQVPQMGQDLKSCDCEGPAAGIPDRQKPADFTPQDQICFLYDIGCTKCPLWPVSALIAPDCRRLLWQFRRLHELWATRESDQAISTWTRCISAAGDGQRAFHCRAEHKMSGVGNPRDFHSQGCIVRSGN